MTGDSYTCYYCEIKHKRVEAGGLWHCPNFFCHGPGAAYFRSDMKSYEKTYGGMGEHTVDETEWAIESIEKLKEDAEMKNLIKETATEASNPFTYLKKWLDA